MHLRRAKAFTLVELMIVVAIVGVLSVLAIGVAGNTAARSRMLGTASDVRAALAEARMRSVRTGRFHKVCIFSDDQSGNPNGVSRGRILTFGCNGTGTQCGVGLFCSSMVDAGTYTGTVLTNPAYLFPDAYVTTPANLERPSFATNVSFPTSNGCDPANTTRWCAIADDAIEVVSKTKVSIAGYVANGAFSTGTLEVTYGPNGLVLPSASTFPSARIRVLHADHCTSGALCNTTTYNGTNLAFQNQLDVEYTFGGAVRVAR